MHLISPGLTREESEIGVKLLLSACGTQVQCLAGWLAGWAGSIAADKAAPCEMQKAKKSAAIQTGDDYQAPLCVCLLLALSLCNLCRAGRVSEREGVRGSWTGHKRTTCKN